MKKRLTIIVGLLVVFGLGMLFIDNKKTKSFFNRNESVGNSHLEYLYGVIKEIRDESIVISLTSSVSESDDLMPKFGDRVYLFVPLKEVQDELLNAYEEGENVCISVYDSNSIHTSNGLYSVVIMDSGQLSKSDLE